MEMRVGELARRTGVGVSTLRAWERRFRFLEPQRSSAGHRLYAESDVERVEAVLRLVGEGLTLPAAITRVASMGTAALPEGEGEALLLAQILNAANEGIWVVRDGRTRYANRRMAEIMHSTVEELLALAVLDIFKPDDLSLVKERTEKIRAGQPLHFIQELRRLDGSVFLAEVNTTPLLTHAGRYEGGVSLVTDITTRSQTEAETRLRARLLDSIGEAVAASATDGTLVYVNAAAERLFGWRAADVVGRPSRDAFPAPGQSEQGARIQASLDAGNRFTGRHKMARRDGSQFVAQLTSEPAFDEQGAVVGFVGVISDETDRDRAEREFRMRELQAETLALLGGQALRQRSRAGTGTFPILTEVADATRRLLHADQATVLDLIADAEELQVVAASPDVTEPIVVPLGSRSFAGYILLAHNVVVVDDSSNDQRFDASPSAPTRPIASAIGAPIFGPDGIRGVLVADSVTPNHFRQGDAHFIQGMANVIGTALVGE